MKMAIAVLISALAIGTTGVYAFSNGGGESSNAPGQAEAIAQCIAVIQLQNANGQTGSETGTAGDNKELNTAVTDCDHFWN